MISHGREKDEKGVNLKQRDNVIQILWIAKNGEHLNNSRSRADGGCLFNFSFKVKSNFCECGKPRKIKI